MKIQLLPSTFDEKGASLPGQHLTCFVIDDFVAVDAGSLAFAATPRQRELVRDVVLTHAHLDHVAGLPLFIDDLFPVLKEPIRVYGSPSVIEVLERDLFNWSIYPRFSELKNEYGPVIEYRNFQNDETFTVGHLKFRPLPVNHKVPSSGFVISDAKTVIAMTGDTSESDKLWKEISRVEKLDALFIECAFPDELADLAAASHHLTPRSLFAELQKFEHLDCRIFVINMKPMHREDIINQIARFGDCRIEILCVGKIYEI